MEKATRLELLCQLGDVEDRRSDGTLEVRLRESGCLVTCSILRTGPFRLVVSRGDAVLVATSVGGGNGVIVGLLDEPIETTDSSIVATDVPDTLLLEATEELTLRVGDGSITIRKDGKILIKGTDLVSSAKRMNRVKGGAVAIN